jgi:hypothetical protein
MPEVTYGQLHRVLRRRGFSVREREDRARVYRHEPTGAVVALPLFADNKAVIVGHLVGVRMTLAAFGIADPTQFAKDLGRAR